MTEVTQKTRIVVGCDLSDTGDNAIRAAVALAKQIPHAELHVTHVLPRRASCTTRKSSSSSVATCRPS
jgi:nucleotide-binding universal stress UspA family protein